MRELFTDHVTGRGPLPPSASATSRTAMLVTSAGPEAWGYRPWHVIREPPIDVHVHKATQRGRQEWRTLAAQLPQIGKGGIHGRSLMKVLGLQPTSADYYHRVGYSYDYLHEPRGLHMGRPHFGAVIDMMIEGMAARQLLRELGYDPRQRRRHAETVAAAVHTDLPALPLAPGSQQSHRRSAAGRRRG